jgi:hypothetical protein
MWCMWSFEIVNQVLVRLWARHRQRSLTGKCGGNVPVAATLLVTHVFRGVCRTAALVMGRHGGLCVLSDEACRVHGRSIWA